MSQTKSDTISRVRDSIKGTNQDAFLTDRLIYSIVLKYAKLYIKREDDKNRLAKYQGLFETIPCVELEEVSAIEACCATLSTCCTFRQTKEKLPPLLEGSYGVILGDITSIDGSQQLIQTFPGIYTRMVNTTNFKYNKTLYYWYNEGYLVFPNIEWEAVAVEGLWEDGIEMFKCDGNKCQTKQEEPTAIPDFLFAEIETNVRQELLTLIQIPKEPAVNDNQSKLRN